MQPTPTQPTPPGGPGASRRAGTDDFWRRLTARGQQFWRLFRPRARQTVANLRVWVPFFANPVDRERTVKYAARESRVGLRWHVGLPRRCWACREQGTLWSREFEVPVRCFEYPLEITAGTVGAAAFFFLLAAVFGSILMLLLCLLSLVAGAAILAIKSWTEDVRVVMHTCPTHAGEMAFPGMVVYDNSLFLTLPTAELADQAREELHAERLSHHRQQPGGQEAPHVERSPAQGGPTFVARPTSQPLPELPPIKLDGDD